MPAADGKIMKKLYNKLIRDRIRRLLRMLGMKVRFGFCMMMSISLLFVRSFRKRLMNSRSHNWIEINLMTM